MVAMFGTNRLNSVNVDAAPRAPKVTITPDIASTSGRPAATTAPEEINRISSANGSPSRSARERSSCCWATSSAISGERPVT